MRVSECIAVVTGGASGLGEACVRELAGAGAKVAIFDLAVERGAKTGGRTGGAHRLRQGRCDER